MAITRMAGGVPSPDCAIRSSLRRLHSVMTSARAAAAPSSTAARPRRAMVGRWLGFMTILVGVDSDAGMSMLRGAAPVPGDDRGITGGSTASSADSRQPRYPRGIQPWRLCSERVSAAKVRPFDCPHRRGHQAWCRDRPARLVPSRPWLRRVGLGLSGGRGGRAPPPPGSYPLSPAAGCSGSAGTGWLGSYFAFSAASRAWFGP